MVETRNPSIEPMLITRLGSSGLEFLQSNGIKSRVSVNIAFTLMSMTLS